MSLLVGIGLSALYIAVLFFVLHPKVSEEYRAYYIERISSDWKPSRYAATPQQGITFSAAGLPSFVRSMYGFSFREPWGRWTDAEQSPVARIVFAENLSGSICLDLKARPANSQAGKLITIALGDQQNSLALRANDFSDYFVDFFEPKPADTLEFRFPGTVPPEDTVDRWNPDSRRLGLAIVYLRLFRSNCVAIQQEQRNLSADKTNHN